MNITQDQKEFIESIIKEVPAYKGKEFLLEEFYNEVVRRAYSFISKQEELSEIKVYIKRIANLVVFEISKNSDKYLNQNNEQDLTSAEEICETEVNYNIDFQEQEQQKQNLSDTQVKNIQEIICSLEEENNYNIYKEIFFLRYKKGFSNLEIAETLEISDIEVDKRLLFLLEKIQDEIPV